MADNYSSKQAARDAEYQRQYREWTSSLSPDEITELKRMGLDCPMLPAHGTGAPGRDIAESSLASCQPAIPADEGESEIDSDGSMLAATRIMRHFVADLLKDSNSRLTIECLAIALGLSAYDGESMSSVARRHNITRAAVSKRCVDITKKLSLQPSRAMRSENARKIYRAAQLKKSKKPHEQFDRFR